MFLYLCTYVIYVHMYNVLTIVNVPFLTLSCFAISSALQLLGAREDPSTVMNSFKDEYRSVIESLPEEFFPMSSKHGDHSFTTSLGLYCACVGGVMTYMSMYPDPIDILELESIVSSQPVRHHPHPGFDLALPCAL